MIGDVMSTAVGGMDTAARSVAEVAQRVANPDRSLRTIERDTVELITGRVSFQANTAVVRTADEMLGTLVDTYA